MFVSFDDMKAFQGKVYSGMSIGGTHAWEYPHGLWREEKVAPDRWVFSFQSNKKRIRKAPEGSGALPGTQYHWFILAHQRVRKLDQDTYETAMHGVKYKVAHKRPYWRRWSTDYPDNEPEREILIRILEGYLADLKEGAGAEKDRFNRPAGHEPGEPGSRGMDNPQEGDPPEKATCETLDISKERSGTV